jgi:hypothetical protein
MIVAAENGDAVLFNELTILKIRCTHAEPECFGFICSRNDTSVVVAEHRNRTIIQCRHEEALAGAVKIIAINDPFHGVFFF